MLQLRPRPARPRRLGLALAAIALTASSLSLATGAADASVTGGVSSSTASAGIGAVPAGPGLTRLLADGTPTGRVILRLPAVPGAAQTADLTALGLQVQPMKALPMAIVTGSLTAVTAAVSQGLALDAYPDERHQYLDTASSNASSSSAVAGTALRERGLTGTGVTVGVVDSGCDATHADLNKRVVLNVKLVSGEYANQTGGPIVEVPVNQGRGSDTDRLGGHGTHVAGIIAADSSSVTDGSRLGVAPGADLACFAIGEGLFTTAVVTAYDYMLAKDDLYGIDVVNNSWGNSYRQVDPDEPMGVATKALADRGVVVVFAAGNSGGSAAPMSLNPFSQFPWVLSVASGTVDRVRSDYSSNGLVYDNSTAVSLPDDGHTVFLGDRIGEVHPDVMAPGEDISSTCAHTGSVVGPCPTGDDNTTISGTSMASPAVAGAVAVLLQAQPLLTPAQVRTVLQATATPDRAKDASGNAPFWQTGYGFVNLDKAVDLVTGPRFKDTLQTASAAADAAVLAADGASVVRSDFFGYTPPPVTAAGTDSRSYTVPVGSDVGSLSVTLAFPSGGTVGASAFSYTVDVKSPAGASVATTTTDATAGSGTAVATVDMTALRLPAGTYTFDVSGDYAASDPDTIDSDSVLGRTVTLQVAQLARNAGSAGAGTPGISAGGNLGASARDTTTPDTRVTKRPRNRSHQVRPNFRFVSTETGAGYQCRIDGSAYRACGRHSRFRVRAGKHVLVVRAIDAAGNVDATPVTVRWRYSKR